MVRVVDCHARVMGSNPGGPRIFSTLKYYTGGSGNSGVPELAIFPLELLHVNTGQIGMGFEADTPGKRKQHVHL